MPVDQLVKLPEFLKPECVLCCSLTGKTSEYLFNPVEPNYLQEIISHAVKNLPPSEDRGMNEWIIGILAGKPEPVLGIYPIRGRGYWNWGLFDVTKLIFPVKDPYANIEASTEAIKLLAEAQPYFGGFVSSELGHNGSYPSVNYHASQDPKNPGRMIRYSFEVYRGPDDSAVKQLNTLPELFKAEAGRLPRKLNICDFFVFKEGKYDKYLSAENPILNQVKINNKVRPDDHSSIVLTIPSAEKDLKCMDNKYSVLEKAVRLLGGGNLRETLRDGVKVIYTQAEVMELPDF